MKRRLLITLQTAFLLSAVAISANAQPVVVTDVADNSTNFVEQGSLVYFTAGDAMWRTDGTSGGTIQLSTGINQGHQWKHPLWGTAFRDKFFFVNANSGEIWRSDGTPAGTFLLHTSSDNDIRILGSTDNYLFFIASDAATGQEVYRTDGTTAGTMIVKDVSSGATSGYRGVYGSAGNYFFFAGNDGVNGTELWKSDGTSAGTVMVEDINPGTGNGIVAGTIGFSFNDRFFFRGNGVDTGMEPWVSDGTADGTYNVEDINTGPESSGPVQYGIANEGYLYFLILNDYDDGPADLWKTAGTSGSTSLIKTLGTYEWSSRSYHSFRIYRGKVYFWDEYGSYASDLWVTDGTASGTGTITSVYSQDGSVYFFEVVNNYLLFVSSVQAIPTNFYRSDGTREGTGEFATFKARSPYIFPRDISRIGDLAFYGDHDGMTESYAGYPYDEEDSYHLFQADGDTTRSMRTMWGVETPETDNITGLNGKVIFTALHDEQKKLWIYDPSATPPPTASFMLVHAGSDKDQKRLLDGASIRNPYDEPINIRYIPVGTPGSVVFNLNGVNVRTETAAPYSLAGDVNGDYAPWAGAKPGAYTLTATPYSESGGRGTPGESLTISFTIECEFQDDDPCEYTGTILREKWFDIEGNSVSDIPDDRRPGSVSQISKFEHSEGRINYGARIRGYVHPPVTGQYTFWIASDDHSELWLSTDEDPVNKVKIASVTGITAEREWDKYPSQRSASIRLEAGKKYYIEALHKQAEGTDYIGVGWQLPDGSLERPIDGPRLSPFTDIGNYNPIVSITNPSDGQTYNAPANIAIEADATDDDGVIAKVEFFEGSNKLGEDLSAPYSFTWNNVGPGSYSLTARATDRDGGAGVSSPVNITVGNGACTASGTILREYWDNIQGNQVSLIPVGTAPSGSSQLTLFEGPTNAGTNYGARIRGYICPPSSGNYTFWIASNDHSELWLSTDDSPENKVKIAYIQGATNPRQWTKFTTQKSALISMAAGKRYYIEALHKQGIGTDNIAVGWQLPDGTPERPIPGNRLSPFSGGGNQAPVVSITHPAEGQSFDAPADIRIDADASDGDGSITKVEFYEGSTKLAEDNTSPYSFTWSDVDEGTYSLTAKAFDNEGAVTTSAVINITVNAAGACTASGTISREYWGGVQGDRVSDIPVHTAPTSTNELTIFEGPTNMGTNYGTRIRGYICPPVTGDYHFWIASNDHSELWLSTDDDPASKVRIAYVQGATTPRQWDKYDSQRSLPIALTQGKRYYIEALHKQGIGSDNIAVGWQLPGGAMERPIPGDRLSPFDTESMMASQLSPSHDAERYSQIDIYPNPVQSGDPQLTIAGYDNIEERIETSVEIINMTGDIVFSDRIICGGDCAAYLMKVNEQLVPGVYLVNMKTKDARYSRRLLVK